ncbi:MAG TPA: hypothetical protein VHB69_15250 [Mycobacteriales bacterium]|nr:hypothetical protein [Mycobacteriales bacterium]
MTPFQEFRLWVRRAPTSQRGAAAVATAVVVALLAWALVPGSGTGNASDGGGGSSMVDVSATPPSPAAAPSSCVGPSGSVPGVTDKTIKLGIIVVNVTGLATNGDLGILPYTEQKDFFGKVVDSINQAGGIDCRQIVPEYFTANPADQNSLEGTCLSIVQAKVFAVVDAGAYAQFSVVDCFAQHHLPYFGGYLLPNSQLTKFYPYLFELNSLDTVYHDTVAGLAARGWFKASNGFKKLGLAYHDCYPELRDEELRWLAAAGVPSSDIVQFDLGCPTTFASPVTMQQAILKFKRAGVTNVTTINMVGDLATFTQLAQVQHFTPSYGFPDDSLINISYGSERPDYANIANAYAITASRDGEERTPSLTPTAATQRCSSILGVDVYKVAAAAGNVCDQLWMLAAAVDHAPQLTQGSLAAGLQAATAVDFSYPQGPNDFAAGTKVTYAGQYWRVTQFHSSCQCWQVIDPTFHPSAQ